MTDATLERCDTRAEGPETRPAPRIVALFGARLLYGQERGNIEVLRALREKGCTVAVVMRPEAWPELERFREEFARLGIRVYGAPFFGIMRGPWFWSSVRDSLRALVFGPATLRAACRDIGATHVYAFNVTYVVGFLPFLWFSALALVFRAGDAPILHNAYHRLLFGLVARRVDRFVAISRFVAGELRRRGVEGSRIGQIYNRPRAPSADPGIARTADGPGGANVDQRQDIVFAGQIIPEKGVRELVEAFRLIAPRHPCAHLILVGRTDDRLSAFASALRDDVSSDPAIAGRVVFAGFVEDVYAHLSGATVHVLPSICGEGLGGVVMEAKQAGVPSVVFPSGGLPEMVADGEDGTVCREKSVAALAEAIEPYLADPALGRRQGAAANASLERLGVPRFAELWLEAIRTA